MLENFKIPDYKGMGVYAIVNITDFKAYVGSSKNLKRRAASHFSALKNGNHNVHELQKDVEKDLRFIVLEKCKNIDTDELHILEYVYMAHFLERRFKLYNTQPFSENEHNHRGRTKYGIIIDHIGMYVISRRRLAIDRKIKEEYGTNAWNIGRMTKERRMIIAKRNEGG